MRRILSRNRFPLTTLLLVSCIASVAGQNLVVPSNWAGTTSDLDYEARVALASGAAAALNANVNPSVQTNPSKGASPPQLPQLRYFSSTFAVFALQDYYSGNSTWNDTVVDGILDYLNAYGFYGILPNTVNSDSVYWGLALYYAYRTYRQQALLDQAIVAWNMTYVNGFITPDVAASGNGAGRNVSILPPSNCTANGTYAGGVFFYKDVHNDTAINAYTVAPFMTLSAYLFEETKETIFQQAAQLSLDFSINRLWNGTVFLDTFWPLSCQYLDSWTSLDEWYIEGIAVWANITGNGTLTTFLETVITNATTLSLWNLDNGNIKEFFDPSDWDSIDKGIYIRALAEARRRNPGTALAKYIEAYITVQFNALLTHARAPNTNYYTTAWSSGPANSTFSASGNIAALDVLNAVFDFVAPTMSSSSPGSTNSSAPGNHPQVTKPASKSSKTGIIAGSVVGSITAIVSVVLLLFLWRRRSQHLNAGPSLPQDPSSPTGGEATANTEPFMLLSSPLPHSGKWQRFYAPRSDEGSAPWSAPPVSEPEVSSPSQSAGYYGDATDHAELPTLVRRLYDLLQGNHGSGELPPQYDERERS
ncbi:unnamed protein product [Peniophora sp. CBMAI 1063]|nr:unnamed protein product [Peniophora sp. CBMAI 1063]